MVHLKPEMCSRARDLWGRRNGRMSIEPDRIVFREHIPMALKNRIAPGMKSTDSSDSFDPIMNAIDMCNVVSQV